jgi:hypothetical protein
MRGAEARETSRSEVSRDALTQDLLCRVCEFQDAYSDILETFKIFQRPLHIRLCHTFREFVGIQ